MDFATLLSSLFGSGAAVAGGWLGNSFVSFLDAIFLRLPDGGTFPSAVHTGAIYFGTTLAKADVFFPTYDLLFCMMLAFTVKMSLWAFYLIKMTVNFVRGVHTEKFDWGGNKTFNTTNYINNF